MSRKSEPKKLDKPDLFVSMNEWMENITKLLKEGFERQLEVLHSEIFQLKKALDEEREKRGVLEKENCELRGEVRYIHGELDFLNGKIEQFDQERRQNDIVVSNIEATDTSDPNKLLQSIVNKTLLVEVISDCDLISTTVIRKWGTQKMNLIGKLKDKMTKKAILTQKKMFVQNKLYVKENLTPYKYGLFKAAKDFAHKEGYKFVWTRDGNVYIRRNEDSNQILVKNKSMISVL